MKREQRAELSGQPARWKRLGESRDVDYGGSGSHEVKLYRTGDSEGRDVVAKCGVVARGL